MTDELEMLVAELRHPIQRNERYYEPLCARAADELERLAALAQSDAEPVAWQYRWKMKLFGGGTEWSPSNQGAA